MLLPSFRFPSMHLHAHTSSSPYNLCFILIILAFSFFFSRVYKNRYLHFSTHLFTQNVVYFNDLHMYVAAFITIFFSHLRSFIQGLQYFYKSLYSQTNFRVSTQSLPCTPRTHTPASRLLAYFPRLLFAAMTLIPASGARYTSPKLLTARFGSLLEYTCLTELLIRSFMFSNRTRDSHSPACCV